MQYLQYFMILSCIIISLLPTMVQYSSCTQPALSVNQLLKMVIDLLLQAKNEHVFLQSGYQLLPPLCELRLQCFCGLLIHFLQQRKIFRYSEIQFPEKSSGWVNYSEKVKRSCGVGESQSQRAQGMQGYASTVGCPMKKSNFPKTTHFAALSQPTGTVPKSRMTLCKITLTWRYKNFAFFGEIVVPDG